MYRAIILLIVFLILAAGSLLYATADGMTTEIDRDSLKVTMLKVSGANIYLVERDGKQLMIDSGNPGDEDKIEGFMRAAGFAPESIDYLILTHGHLDHLGNAAHFQSRYGVKIIGGQGDALMFSEGTQQPLCATSALGIAIDTGLRGKTYPLFEADILVDAPFDLQELGINGSITPMPGHTEGTLLVSFDEAVFVGDLIRGEVYRTNTPTRHFFMCDLPDNDADIRQLLEQKNLTRWYTGHFGPLDAAAVSVWQGEGL